MFNSLKICTLTLVFLTSLLFTGLNLTASPASAAVDLDGMENRIHALTNKSRAANGKAGLGKQACVQRFAQKQANKQAAQKSMFHQSLSPILKSCRLSLVGENVAYGYTSPGAVQKAWMNSPGHRANILESRYRFMGVGVAAADDGTLYYAVVFGRA